MHPPLPGLPVIDSTCSHCTW